MLIRFHGNSQFSVDSKGRVNIPSKFRSALSPEAYDTFTISLAPDGCLRAYPSDIWEICETELLSRPETPGTVHLKRLLYSMLTDSTMDTQGRITLSPKQMESAGITKEVTLVGQGNYIEVWDKARYEAYQTKYAAEYDQMYYNSVQTGIPKQ